MKYLFAPVGSAAGRVLGLVLSCRCNDMNFGYVILTRQVHDLVFQLYGEHARHRSGDHSADGGARLRLRRRSCSARSGRSAAGASCRPGARAHYAALLPAERIAERQRLKPVEHALQDKGGGRRIDACRRASCVTRPSRSAPARPRPSTAARPRTRRAGRSTSPCCARRRATPGRADLREPSMLTGRPITTARDFFLRQRGDQRCGVQREFLAHDHRARMREGEAAVGDREPDGLVAEIDPGKRPAGSQQRRAVLRW